MLQFKDSLQYTLVQSAGVLVTNLIFGKYLSKAIKGNQGLYWLTHEDTIYCGGEVTALGLMAAALTVSAARNRH